MDPRAKSIKHDLNIIRELSDYIERNIDSIPLDSGTLHAVMYACKTAHNELYHAKSYIQHMKEEPQ